jgi:hypothetical protein
MPLLPILLALQGAAAPAPDTATYASPAVRTIVERAAEQNHRVPPGLGSYRVKVESEISLSLRRREGPEVEGSIEQVASDVQWDRSGAAEQRVEGYRSQQVGPTFSALSYISSAWVVPSLYGNRLAILFGRDSTTRSRTASDSTRPRAYAVHPLADDRETTYRYDGGDTVVTIRHLERDIRIVRIMVTPRTDLSRRTTVFEGEMDLDAERFHIVRLRGSFSTVSAGSARSGLLGNSGVQGVVYVELVNAEYEGQWWLPSTQRFESQVTAAAFGDTRAVFRILSRFGAYDVAPPVDVAADDSLRARPHRITYAPQDSLGRFGDWRLPIGEATSTVTAADFDDVAPEAFSFSGRPQLLFQPERIHDLLHVNRVEGLFTGAAATLRLRDAAPGVLLRGTAGYAWSEGVARWRAIGEWRRGPTLASVRVGRQLDVTNKFLNGLDSASSIVTFFGDDFFDYVDRRSVGAQLARTVGAKYGKQVRLDVALVEDRNAVTNYRGLPLGSEVRENRGVAEGRYGRTIATWDWRPNVNGEFLRPGLGARLRYERGDGDTIAYQLVSGLLGVRSHRGPVVLAARLDAGVVISDAPPPQQLFELGSYQGLEGYEGNAFAGDRAALFRSVAMYQLPIGRSPLRVRPRLWLPAPSPAIAIGLHAGWTEASSVAARDAVLARGEVCTGTAPVVCRPVARPSEGWRGAGVVGLRVFGGVASIGAAKPFDGRGWRGVVRMGGQL